MSASAKAGHFKRLLLCLLTLALFAGPAGAQEAELFSPANWTTDSLDESQLERYEKLLAAYPTESVFKVEVEELAAAVDSNTLSVDIQGSVCGLSVFKGLNVQYESAQQFTWYGRLEPEEGACEYGYLLLMGHDGEKFGQVRIEDDLYELEDIGGKNILIKMEPDSANALACEPLFPDSSYSESSNAGEPLENREGGISCDVSVLVLYTPAAADRLGEANIPNRAMESIAITNQALRNSDVSEFQLNFILAGVEELNINETGARFGDVLDDMAFGVNNAPQLRNDFNADIVILFVDRAIMRVNSPSGIAYVGPSANFAYGVVQIINANTAFTFSHEVGHIMGLNHEPCTAEIAFARCCTATLQPGQCFDSPTSYDHAHTWTRKRGPIWAKKEINQLTVMTSVGVFMDRIPHYSNPEAEVIGKPTGIAGERHNTRELIDHACTVAGFRTSTEGYDVSIIGSHHGCSSTQQELCIGLDNVEDPISWRWMFSYDGINYFYLQNQDDEECIPAYFPSPGYIRFYRLEVTFPNNVVFTSGAFYVTGYDCGEERGVRAAPKLTGRIPFEYINPIQNQNLLFGFHLETEREVSFVLSDIRGRQVLVENLGVLAPGYHQVSRFLNWEQSGLLFLSLRMGEEQKIARLLAYYCNYKEG